MSISTFSKHQTKSKATGRPESPNTYHQTKYNVNLNVRHLLSQELTALSDLNPHNTFAMAAGSISNTSNTASNNGVGSKIQNSFKSTTQYISRKAKEHHASVNEAYQTYYGLNVPSSRRTSGASAVETVRYA